MPKLYSSDYIVKVLLRMGFEFVSQKGSHAKFRKDGHPVLTVIVPMGKKEIPFGTFRSILRQSNLSMEDFQN
ncbi:type II toxin-antitoxin system HicA family toxin [Runella salmonicolor]|uniref:Type II toxin-antitoxin system HicA family toxin n=1 Tax=Runella salmonicolor TaxID=2950278 RepID=A0ABT1FTY3_9BACT|nr:type II toxin-antitoxin system HicA family toxin [Runella salmonicolor]MCP1384950.1 type II toxin-antitoxin system HicA family toxin [Runella salmonicolor]